MLNLLRAFRPIASDFLSTITFIIAYEATGSIYAGVGVGIVAAFGQVGWLKWRGRRIDVMQWASLALVVVLGSATLLTRNPQFIMIKPTIAAFAIAAVMLRPNWMARYLPPVVLENVSPRLPLVWGYIWAGAVFALGVANLVVAFTCSPKIWAWFTSFVPIGVQLSLFLLQYQMIRWTVVHAIRARTMASA
ncbi:MAG TPA: septation protein IspZ [Rhizomicrobium sp.]|jgi:intracellular septation protein A|nr:septation protein IspZ [Rhizomicrobium sp.]